MNTFKVLLLIVMFRRHPATRIHCGASSSLKSASTMTANSVLYNQQAGDWLPCHCRGIVLTQTYHNVQVVHGGLDQKRVMGLGTPIDTNLNQRMTGVYLICI